MAGVLVFATLHHKVGVGKDRDCVASLVKVRVAGGVIQVQMGVDDQVDVAWRQAEPRQSRAEVSARARQM